MKQSISVVLLLLIMLSTEKINSLAQDTDIDEDVLELAFTGVESNDEWEPVIKAFQGVDMVLVPAGEFRMGMTETEKDFAFSLCQQSEGNSQGFPCNRSWFETESPVSQQTIASFWIDRFEVSRTQYQVCVDAGACVSLDHPSDRTTESNPPMNELSWFEARDYCIWRGGRLPTESEWEYAARGPDDLQFPWGDEFRGDIANHCDQNCRDQDWARSLYDSMVNEENNDGYGNTAPVGSYPEDLSWVGAFGMAGNITEWTSSQYVEYPYDGDDGREVPVDEVISIKYVVRGGSFNFAAYSLLSADRSGRTSRFRYDFVGVRCARDFEG